MKSVDGSSGGGISDHDGKRMCPRSSKNARKPSRSSAVVFTALVYGRPPGARPAEQAAERRERASSCAEIGVHAAQGVTDPARLQEYARPRVAGGHSDFP